MKKTLYLALAVILFSCKKNDTPAPLQDSDIESAILGKKTYAEFSTMPKEDVVKLIKFLDTAPKEKVDRVFSKIHALQSEVSGKKNIASAFRTGEEPSEEELNDVVFPSLPDYADAMDLEGDGQYTVFHYDWVVMKQVADLWTVTARDRFILRSQGNSYPIQTRYVIESLNHVTSYLSGFAPGMTWQDTGDENYAGDFHALLKTTGVRTFMGFNIPGENARYVHAGTIFTSLGAQFDY